MARKFTVHFSKQTNLSPSVVFVSKNETSGKFSASVLHANSSIGSFDSPEGICKHFDLHNIGELNSEEDAIDRATTWLNSNSLCLATLIETCE